MMKVRYQNLLKNILKAWNQYKKNTIEYKLKEQNYNSIPLVYIHGGYNE